MFVGEFLLPQVSQNITSILILLIFVGDFFDSLLQKESATEKHYESGWHFNSPVAKRTKWWSSTLGAHPRIVRYTRQRSEVTKVQRRSRLFKSWGVVHLS
jgi:hypothetical protein